MKTEAILNVSEERLTLMKAGIADLNQWLLDITRHGLAALENKDESYWVDMASRLVDCKLGSLARRVRLMAEIPDQDSDWPSRMLEQIGDLYLAVKGFSNLENLPGPLRSDLLTFAGVNISKKKLSEQQGLEDSWLVMGSHSGIEENLTYRRTWFQGAKSKRLVLLLDFVHGNQSFDHNWQTGTAVSAEAVFYPSGYPLRAVFKLLEDKVEKAIEVQGFDDFSEFATAYARARAGNPWLLAFPGLLNSVIPAQESEHYFCIDKNKRRIPLTEDDTPFWQVMALSGGLPVNIFGEWDGREFLPISVQSKNRLIAL